MSYVEDLSAITTPSLTDLLYVYQNGTDYNISNSQLLELIKTNTIIPITQANYDLLPSADKNNGAIYIITDGTITADDVEYSSGVSVGDKLDSLSEVTSGVATLDSTYMQSAEINNWTKVGRVVELHLTATVKTDFTSTNTIASGYPPPLTTGRFLGLNTSSNEPIRIAINSNGAIGHAYSKVNPQATRIIELHLTYISAN